MTRDQSTALAALLATHAPQLRALLPTSFWPLVPVEVKEYGPLTKYTLGPLDDGRWAMLHHVTAVDTGPPHDHPVRFESHILVGGYRETIYRPGHPTHPFEDIDRRPGSCHFINPDTIHRLTGLPAGECWSLCFAGPVVRAVSHYPGLV